MIGVRPAHGATAFGLDNIPHIYMYFMQTVYDYYSVSVYVGPKLETCPVLKLGSPNLKP